MYCPLSSHTLSCTFCLLIVGGVCDFLSSVLSQQKFEAARRTSITALRQASVTAQFYLQSKGKYILEAWGHANPKDMKRREALAQFWLSRCQLFATPWTVANQAPLSMGFSRWEYWGGLPFPSPGGLPDPGIELGSPALQTGALPSEPPGKPLATAILDSFLLFKLPNIIIIVTGIYRVPIKNETVLVFYVPYFI